MVTATNSIYSVAAGATIYAGMAAPGGGGGVAPAWMSNAVLNQWTALPNSSVTQPNMNSFSGFVVDDSLNIWLAAAGGHTNGNNNAVSKYALGTDSPNGWTLVRAASTPTPNSLPYFSDGRPNARHIYEKSFYDPSTNHVILVDCYAPSDGSDAYNSIDGFNIDTGDWEIAGTYPYANGGSSLTIGGFYNGGFFRDPVTGNAFWAQSGATRMWKPGQSSLTSKGTTIATVRFPNCWDSTRNGVFGIMWSDGQSPGTNSVSIAHTLNPSSGSPTIRNITINSSSAYTTFQNNTPLYGAMDYDPIRDRYLFMHGTGGSVAGIDGAPTFYEIIPNAGTGWDMVIPSSFSGAVGTIQSSGAVGKLKYISKGGIGGFIMYSNSLYFLRTI